MAFTRIAICYDDSLRPDTTGGYCLRALRRLASAEHYPPERLARLPADHDLYLCVDDGLDYAFPRHPSRSLGAGPHPSAFWAIDTHLNFPRALRRARDFDFVFAAQRQGAEQLRQGNWGQSPIFLARFPALC